MPGFDGTGPAGMGPMTGGGRGFCGPWGIRAAFAGYGTFPRVGYGYPYGWAGAAYSFYGAPAVATGATPFAPPLTREQEIGFLKDEAGALKRTLEEIDARIKELAGEGA